MKKYLGLNLNESLHGADLSALYPPEFMKLHLHTVQANAMAEIERNFEEDEDL